MNSEVVELTDFINPKESRYKTSSSANNFKLTRSTNYNHALTLAMSEGFYHIYKLVHRLVLPTIAESLLFFYTRTSQAIIYKDK